MMQRPGTGAPDLDTLGRTTYDAAMRYLIALMLFAGCAGREIVPTPGNVVRVEGGGFRACTIHLGWTEAELVAECGDPVRIVPWIDHGSAAVCLIYHTTAQPFTGVPSAPWLAACIEQSNLTRSAGVVRRAEKREGAVQVTAVYALSSDTP